jgi:hypothetical protein
LRHLQVLLQDRQALLSKLLERIIVALFRIGREERDAFFMRLNLELRKQPVEILAIGALQLIQHGLVTGIELFGRRRIDASLLDDRHQLVARL